MITVIKQNNQVQIQTIPRNSITISTGAGEEMGNQSYHHVQGVPSSLWVIAHNLGFYPAGIVVIDSLGDTVEGNVIEVTTSIVRVEFGAAFSGDAYVS